MKIIGLLFSLFAIVSTGCSSADSAARGTPVPEPALPVAPVAPVAAEPDWFEDRTPGSGIDFSYTNGEQANHYTILESLGGGVALFDYDRDGRIDIFCPGGGSFEGANPPRVQGKPSKLYRNLGNWRFEDVTSAVGLDTTGFYSHGAAVGDFNCDGWPDLYVSGYRGGALFANCPADGGKRSFRNVTVEAGLPAIPWGTSAAFADLDGDGFPELFVCQYLEWSFDLHKTCPHGAVPQDVCSPHAFRPLRPFLFRNLGQGTFEDVSARSGLRADGKGLGVVICDVDNDGRPDIYVANDSTDNHLYLNTPAGLEECGLTHGVAVDDTGHVNGSMGIAVGDWDRSGRPSLFVTNFQNEWHAFYENLGGGKFRYHTHPSGIARLGQNSVGFGTAMTDFDNDGWLDLAISNGHVFRHPTGSTLAQKPVLLRNVPEGTKRRWVEVTDIGGAYFRSRHVGRGLATADLDSDGWLDLVICHQNAPIRLLRNMGTQGRQNTNRSVQFRLQRQKGKDMIGTRFLLISHSGTQTASVCSGGYLTSNSTTLHFGLGSDPTIHSVEVHWSFGQRQVFRGPISGNRCWTVTEGDTSLGESPAVYSAP